jgi:hypothetical protein
LLSCEEIQLGMKKVANISRLSALPMIEGREIERVMKKKGERSDSLSTANIELYMLSDAVNIVPSCDWRQADLYSVPLACLCCLHWKSVAN